MKTWAQIAAENCCGLAHALPVVHVRATHGLSGVGASAGCYQAKGNDLNYFQSLRPFTSFSLAWLFGSHYNGHSQSLRSVQVPKRHIARFVITGN